MNNEEKAFITEFILLFILGFVLILCLKFCKGSSPTDEPVVQPDPPDPESPTPPVTSTSSLWWLIVLLLLIPFTMFAYIWWIKKLQRGNLTGYEEDYWLNLGDTSPSFPTKPVLHPQS